MKICIVGGIFDKSNEYQLKHRLTPETILFAGLAAKGLDVTKIGHYSFNPSADFDIIHVHHLGRAAIKMALSSTPSLFVFTGHNGRILSGYEKSIKQLLAFRFIVRKADQLIGLSEEECRFLRNYSGNKGHVSKIPNGIPADLYYPITKEKVLPGHLFHILFVGQLIPSKGVDILFKALKNVKGRIPWRLSLVYQNSSQEKHYIELAQKLGILEQVHFIGFLSSLELAEFYRIVDVLVLPSYAEALPSVIIESLLSGTPVVATRVGGIPEQVVEPFGELVKPGDWIELSETIIRVFKNLSSYRKYGQAMHEFAASRFSVDQMVSDHIKLYESVQVQSKPRDNKAEKMFLRLTKMFRYE